MILLMKLLQGFVIALAVMFLLMILIVVITFIISYFAKIFELDELSDTMTYYHKSTWLKTKIWFFRYKI